MSIRVGHILRLEDESGVSGTGRVAEWVEYSDGEVVVHWLSHTPSTNHYRNMKQMEAIHGHNGKTQVVVDWTEPKPARNPEEGGESAVEAPEGAEEAEVENSGESEIGPVEDEPEGAPEAEPKKSSRRKAAKKKEQS